MFAKTRRLFSTRVWMDIKRDDTPLGRMTFKLYDDKCPKTVSNFKQILTASNEQGLHYKEARFHRIVTDFMVQGGDITNGDGTGSISVYGKRFKDENLKIKLNKRGILAMANSGRDTNGSQFFITFKETPWLDGLHVVLGEMIEGEEVLTLLQLGGSLGGLPTSEFRISDCGIEPPKNY